MAKCNSKFIQKNNFSTEKQIMWTTLYIFIVVFWIIEYVQNKTVAPDDSVSFTCSFFHDDANIDIEWAVDDSNDIMKSTKVLTLGAGRD